MIYINTEKGSHKFWGYDCKCEHMTGAGATAIKQWRVTCYWGRIGQSLKTCQRKEFEFNSEWEAQEFIEDKLKDKRNKGYRPIEGTYEDMIEGRDFDSSSGISAKQDIVDPKKIDIF